MTQIPHWPLFAPTPPDAIKRGALQERLTTKFLLPRDQIAALVTGLEQHYTLLRANDRCEARYRTLHFDTDDLTFFHGHRRGMRRRSKVRIRHYDDRHLTVLEVKQRLHEQKTIKFARKLAFNGIQLQAEDQAWAASKLPLHRMLCPKLWTDFNRVILISKHGPERVTIDIDLLFKNEVSEYSFPATAIIEVKQPRLNRNSPIMVALRKLRGHSVSFSKYCAATALLNPELPHNRFEPQLRQLERISL